MIRNAHLGRITLEECIGTNSEGYFFKGTSPQHLSAEYYYQQTLFLADRNCGLNGLSDERIKYS